MEAKEMMDIGIGDLIPGVELPIDVYVLIGSGNYIQVAKKGTKTNLQDLHVTEKQADLRLYIKKTEYSLVVDVNSKVANLLLKRPDLPLDYKIHFLKTTMRSTFRQLTEFGFDEKLFVQSKGTVSALVGMVQKKEEHFALIEVLHDLPGHLVKNSVAVASLSVLIGKVLGWQAPVLEKLAMGALFRDVGLSLLPEALLQKRRADMSALERMTYETHPKKSAEILRRIPGFPSEGVLIAMEHHENSIGQGFPHKSHDFAQNPLAKVVALADLFIDLTLPPTGDEPKTTEQAVHFIESALGLPFNRSVFLALKKAFEIRH